MNDERSIEDLFAVPARRDDDAALVGAVMHRLEVSRARRALLLGVAVSVGVALTATLLVASGVLPLAGAGARRLLSLLQTEAGAMPDLHWRATAALAALGVTALIGAATRVLREG